MRELCVGSPPLKGVPEGQGMWLMRDERVTMNEEGGKWMIKKMDFMRRGILLIFLLAGFVYGGRAQGIQFENPGAWKQVVRKAAKEKKLLFVDCYTDWCGPCYAMAKTVFTQDTVGRFFNTHFVNAKFEMEKNADGKMLKERYRVEAYPTMLFIDPVTGDEVYRLIGQRTPEGLLEHAAVALDPQRNTAGLARRYAAGERTPEFLLQYHRALSDAALPGSREIALEYLDALDVEQLAAPAAWGLFVRYVSDPLAKPFRLVLSARERFDALAGKETVGYKLQGDIETAVAALGEMQNADSAAARQNELIRLLKTVDDPVVPGALAGLYAMDCVRRGDFRGLADGMQVAARYHFFRREAEKKYFADCVGALEECEDKALIQEVIRLLETKCAEAVTFYGKADFIKLKAALQKQMGDDAGATESLKQAEAYRNQGDDAGEWL